MGITMHYLKEYNFILSKLSGEINDQNLREYVLAFNKKTRGIPNLRELADCREIENLENMTVRGATSISQDVENHPDSIIAILVNDSTLLYGMARSYQMFQYEKRKAAEIFKDIDEALSWLSDNDSEIEEFKKFVENT